MAGIWRFLRDIPASFANRLAGIRAIPTSGAQMHEEGKKLAVHTCSRTTLNRGVQSPLQRVAGAEEFY